MEKRAAIRRILVLINFEQLCAARLVCIVVEHLLLYLNVLCNWAMEEGPWRQFFDIKPLLDVVVLVKSRWNFGINRLQFLILLTELLIQSIHNPKY